MQKIKRSYAVISLLSLLVLLPGCGIDNSTNLGKIVIEDKFPESLTPAAHLRSESVDSIDRISLPAAGAMNFGIHEVTGSHLVIGSYNGDSADGFVRFACLPDTFSSRKYGSTDSLRNIVIRFSRDSIAKPCSLGVWHYENNDINAALTIVPYPPLGTMNFHSTIDTLNDSIVIPKTDSLALIIFRACTTSNKVTASTLKDTFNFIIKSIRSDSLVGLVGNPVILVHFKRGTDTTLFFPYYATRTTYYIARESTPDSIALSYASKKTVVFQYGDQKLWDSIKAFPHSDSTTQFVDVNFSLIRPGAPISDTLQIRYVVSDSLKNDGAQVDSLFADNKSPPGTVTVIGSDTVQANVTQSFNLFNRPNRRLPTLFFYLRFAEDVKQNWKKVSWKTAPAFSATVAFRRIQGL